MFKMKYSSASETGEYLNSQTASSLWLWYCTVVLQDAATGRNQVKST